MSTYLDHPYQGTPYVSGIPLDLVMKVGAAKQARYDANAQAIQDNLNHINDYNIEKPSDRAALSEQFGNTVNELNELGGLDLSDSRVYGKLQGITAKLYNNPEVYSRISDNVRAHTARKNMMDIKEKHPELYNDLNAEDFLEKYESWYNTPGKSFSGEYVPYTDVNKWSTDITDKLLKNPDIMNQIQYTIDPDTGKEVERGRVEVKELTAQKIHDTLMSNMDSKIQSQLMIEYRGMMRRMTPQSADKSLKTNQEAIDAQISSVDKMLELPLSEAQKNYATSLKEELQRSRAAVIKGRNDIAATGDTSSYYTPTKYLSDYATAQGNAWKMKQEGKMDDDFTYTENVKTRNSMKLEKFKSDIQMAQAEAFVGMGFTPNGGSAGKGSGSGLTSADGTPLVANPFQNEMMTLMNNKVANFSGEKMAALFNSDSQLNENGEFQIHVGDQPVFVDVKSTLEAAGVSGSIAELNALSGVMSDYSAWTKSKDGHTTHKEAVAGWATGGGEYRYTEKALPFEDYVAWVKKTKGDAGLKEKGIDISNPEAMAKAKQAASDPKVIEAVTDLGSLFKNPKFGRINVVPGDGNNVFIGNDGNAYTKVFAQVSEKQLETVFGKDGWFSDKGWMKLKEKGLISDTGREDKDGNTIYEVPLISKVGRDFADANLRYLSKKVDKNYVDNMPMYDQAFRTMMSDMQSVSDIASKAPSTVANDAYNQVRKLNISDEEGQRAKDRIKLAQAILERPTSSSTEKLNALKTLQAITVWDGKNASAAPVPSVNGVDPKATMSRPGSEEKFKVDIPKIKKAIAANESTGYGIINPSSGAMGKYQFLESTLRSDVYDDYKDKYSSFVAFKRAFMKSSTLQEEVMDKWLYSIGKQSNWNPYRTAMTHYLGAGGVQNLLAGNKSWNTNPTEGIHANVAPVRYFTIFANNYDN
jgi:hypothetical protein